MRVIQSYAARGLQHLAHARVLCVRLRPPARSHWQAAARDHSAALLPRQQQSPRQIGIPKSSLVQMQQTSLILRLCCPGLIATWSIFTLNLTDTVTVRCSALVGFILAAFAFASFDTPSRMAFPNAASEVAVDAFPRAFFVDLDVAIVPTYLPAED